MAGICQTASEVSSCDVLKDYTQNDAPQPSPGLATSQVLESRNLPMLLPADATGAADTTISRSSSPWSACCSSLATDMGQSLLNESMQSSGSIDLDQLTESWARIRDGGMSIYAPCGCLRLELTGPVTASPHPNTPSMIQGYLFDQMINGGAVAAGKHCSARQAPVIGQILRDTDLAMGDGIFDVDVVIIEWSNAEGFKEHN